MKVNIVELMRPIETTLVMKYHMSQGGLRDINKQIMSYIGDKIVPLFQQGIELVYDRNYERVPGSLPIEQVKDSVTYTIDVNHLWTIDVFWDDTLVEKWETAGGDPIYMYHANGRTVDKVVTTFQQHWRSPIRGVTEEGYIINHIMPEVKEFLDSTELQMMIRKAVVSIVGGR